MHENNANKIINSYIDRSKKVYSECLFACNAVGLEARGLVVLSVHLL